MKSEKLEIPTTQELYKELKLKEPSTLHISIGEDQNLDTQADLFVKKLMEFELSKPQQQEIRKNSIEQMGIDLQKKAAQQSSLLKQPIKMLSNRGEDGGDVANALIGLKMKVEELDPGQLDLEPGWLSRTLGRIPGIGTPLKRYFSKYESAQTIIAAIIRSLESGKEQLSRDNITLLEDQKQMRQMTYQLEQMVKLGQLIDQKLQYKVDREISSDDPLFLFINEELLFPLRQRIIDLQQQLAVNQQGVLATELIIRNNKELIRGVHRALNVTVTALEVGTTVAMALANQKVTLEKIQSVNKTTSDLIASTAHRLKTQGVEIQKQASMPQVSLESLKSAFVDLKGALDDVSTFRIQALPQMAQSIIDLDRMSSETEKTIKRMEEGNRVRPDIKIELMQ